MAKKKLNVKGCSSGFSHLLFFILKLNFNIEKKSVALIPSSWLRVGYLFLNVLTSKEELAMMIKRVEGVFFTLKEEHVTLKKAWNNFKINLQNRQIPLDFNSIYIFFVNFEKKSFWSSLNHSKLNLSLYVMFTWSVMNIKNMYTFINSLHSSSAFFFIKIKINYSD